MTKNVSKALRKLIELNDPRALKMSRRIEKIAAAEDQKAQREAAEKRKARDAAIFVLGGALLAAVEAKDAAALAFAAKIAAASQREQDALKIARAVELEVISAVFVKRATLTLPASPVPAPAPAAGAAAAQ